MNRIYVLVLALLSLIFIACDTQSTTGVSEQPTTTKVTVHQGDTVTVNNDTIIVPYDTPLGDTTFIIGSDTIIVTVKASDVASSSSSITSSVNPSSSETISSSVNPSSSETISSSVTQGASSSSIAPVSSSSVSIVPLDTNAYAMATAQFFHTGEWAYWDWNYTLVNMSTEIVQVKDVQFRIYAFKQVFNDSTMEYEHGCQVLSPVTRIPSMFASKWVYMSTSPISTKYGSVTGVYEINPVAVDSINVQITYTHNGTLDTAVFARSYIPRLVIQNQDLYSNNP